MKKKEFHVTLLHAKSLPELEHVANDELAAFFDSFVEEYPIKLVSFIDDFRYDEEQEKKTVIIRCTVSKLDKLFETFNKQYKVRLPVQPAHVTLYSLDPLVGIHINSEEKMESLERVHLPELSKALAAAVSKA